ncbi:MAG: DUF1080 domain-containing protein [Phycisphaerae bacterium]|jgi:type 1 glutamine amidotransferase
MLRQFVSVCLLVAGFMVVGSATAAAQPADATAKITAAAPDKAPATPQKPRRLLVFTLCRGFVHSSIPLCSQTMEILGRRTGAFDVVVSDDIEMFTSARLAGFDAVCMNNTTGELFLPTDFDKLPADEQAAARQRDEQLKKSLLDYVRNGGGLVGIHAATDCFYKWPEFGEMMGGYFNGHPWNEEVTIKVDEPKHPVVAMFKGQPLVIADEIYQFREPYSRENLRVLLSLDATRTNMDKQGINRTDGDFAVSWVRNYGKGRIFYCSLGHRDEIYWQPQVLQHYLAGIQFAMGDLLADAAPSAQHSAAAPASTGDWKPLFNGRDLTGWRGLAGDPKALATLSPAERNVAQMIADENMRQHWSVQDGVIVFDGQGSHLCTAADYSDYELKIDWKIEAGGDSGIYLRGSPQVQIWDPAEHPEGSGGLYNNEHHPSKPLVRADRPVGEWNTFLIRLVGDRVSVTLNDQFVVDDVPLENYWERDKPLYPTGDIQLQSHGSKLCFRNIAIRELPPAAATPASAWRELFNGRDLTGWHCKPETWVVDDGALMCKGGSYIWTDEQFGDFILELEFRIPKDANSGIFFRTANVNDPVQTGQEIQVLDSYGRPTVDKHDCGALYNIMAPRVNAVFKPGEWNHVVLTCRGGHITNVMNGELLVDVDLNQWTEPEKNPDGTPNKFKTAYKNMPRSGYIGFQDHGNPVWYRHIRIKLLTAAPTTEHKAN